MPQRLHLVSFKHLCNSTIKCMPAPARVVMNLNQHADALLRSCVRPGEFVAIGQVIAKPDAMYSAWLHASISGAIRTVNDEYIVIDNDHQDTASATGSPLPEWRDSSSLELIAYLARGGIAGLGGAGYSTAAKLSAHARQNIETLLINGMECEPYITCDDHLMREQAPSILQGVQVLLHACNAKRALIAIEDDKAVAIESMRNAVMKLADDRITIHVLPTAYPNGDEGQLTRLLLNKEIPRGQLPASIGVVINNVATAHACAQWVNHGLPLISRIVTITGHGIHNATNVEVRVGTACKDVIDFCGGYNDNVESLIVGGSMMGHATSSDDVTITKATNCLIAATTQDISPRYIEQPCIRCGECAQVCPANLLPQQLHGYLRNQRVTAALELGLNDCIECGCCDAVCPSHIALASQFRSAKLSLSKNASNRTTS